MNRVYGPKRVRFREPNNKQINAKHGSTKVRNTMSFLLHVYSMINTVFHPSLSNFQHLMFKYPCTCRVKYRRILHTCPEKRCNKFTSLRMADFPGDMQIKVSTFTYFTLKGTKLVTYVKNPDKSMALIKFISRLC